MSTTREELVVHAIREDAAFVGRYISAQQRPENQVFASTLAFCMGSYLALFIHEGQRKLQTIDPMLAAELSPDAKQVLARSRHGLKFFEDTKRGLDGVRRAFGDEIIPAHRDHFVGSLRWKWLEPLAKDVGVFRYEGRVVSTTHAATFALGLDASAISSDNLGLQMRSRSEEYGQYFGRLGARLDASQTAFPDFLDAAKFPRRVEDLRSAEFYSAAFNGAATPDLNAALLMMLGHLNFVADIVAPVGSGGMLDYTTFKIRFLAVYQVIRSLKILRDEQSGTLTERSMRTVDAILQHPAVVSILQDDVRPLRNTLTHYGIDTRLDSAKIDVQDFPLSLAAATLGNDRADQFLADFDDFVPEAAQLMNGWMECI